MPLDKRKYELKEGNFAVCIATVWKLILILTLKCLLRNEITILRYSHPHFHCSIIYNRQDMERA